jgi:hypothetical protein
MCEPLYQRKFYEVRLMTPGKISKRKGDETKLR